MRLRNFLGALFAAVSLSATAAIPATETAELVEFYNASLDHYFITIEPKEISDLDTGVHPGWVRTGYRFLVVRTGSAYAGTVPVCRFYGRPEKGIDSHFYSAKASECEDVKNKFPDAWVFETPEAFRAFPVSADGTCPTDTGRVNRLYNNRPDVNHRYTDQPSVFFFMVGKGYTPEGDGNPNFPIAFCAPTGGSVVPPPAPGAPDCTVSASSAVPALGSTLTLTAQCTNTPTKYVWAGCTSTTATCQTTQSAAGAKSYTLYASNAAGPAPAVTQTVTWGGVSGNVPICTLSASASPLNTGTPLVLNANCNQSPNRYDWYECDYLIQSICNIMPVCAATASSCTVNKTIAGYARYAVAAGNGSGTGPKAAVDVEWRQGSGGGGGGGGNDPIPVCALLVNNSTPIVGTTVVLTAACTGNPTSYLWSGVACSGVQCAATSSTPGTVTYSVSASNGAGTGGIAYGAVNWQSSAPVPTCTLSASNPTPPTGTTVTISASCTNSPTSYAWSGCSSNGPNCTDNVTVAGTKEYTLVASNGAGPGTTASISVQWTGPVTAAPVCTIAASSATPTVGQSVTLTATCNGSPTSYVWTNCTSTTATCVAAATAAGQVTYYVAGTNAIGTGTAAGVPVTWQAAGGGGGGGADFCGSYQNVIRTSVNWGDFSRITTGGIGGFSSDGVLVMSFTVPATPGTYPTPGYTSLAEYSGPPALRHMTLSKNACDFRPVDPTGAAGPFDASYGKQVTIYWNVGAEPIALRPGETYYFNTRNTDYNGVSDCQSICNAGISTIWPH
ncbi:MAG: hypothetical protein U1F58_07065 [Burkholderiales bacterium]